MKNRYEFRFVDMGQADWVSTLNGFGFDGFRVVAAFAVAHTPNVESGSVLILQRESDDA